MERRTVVVLALLLLGASCAPRPVLNLTSYEAPIISVPLDTASHMLAFTKCDKDGHAVIVVSATGDEKELYYTIEHEKTHVKQMQRLGLSCEQFQHRYTDDKDFRFQMEAEAYCIGFTLHVYMRDYNYTLSYPNFVDFVNTVFPDMTREEIYNGLPCKPLETG